MTRRTLAVVMVVLGLAVSAAAVAQPAGEEPSPVGREGRRLRVDDRYDAEREGSGAEQRARIRERVRLLRAWRLTEVIDMDEATAAQLFELLDRFDEQQAAHEATLGEGARELRQLLESGEGDDARISELLDQILTAHLSIEEGRAQLVRDAGAFLTPRQQAALMLFIPEFDSEIRQMVSDVRRGRRERRERRVEEREEIRLDPEIPGANPLPTPDPPPIER